MLLVTSPGVTNAVLCSIETRGWDLGVCDRSLDAIPPVPPDCRRVAADRIGGLRVEAAGAAR